MIVYGFSFLYHIDHQWLNSIFFFISFFMQGVRLQSPDMPPIRDYIDLCDGVCLAYLISYYCPNIVPWTSVRINYMPTVEDSISNILLVSNFSQKHLPYSVFHMTPQDVTYMRGYVPFILSRKFGNFFF